MNKKNLLSGRNKELQEYADLYDAAISENKTFYLDADDFADLADWYGTRKNYDKAIEIAEYGLRLHPRNTDLLIEYAYLLIDSGQKDKAREVVKDLPETYLPEVKILHAHLLLDEGRLNDAERLLDTIEDKEGLANVADVAYLYLEMGYPDKAKEWLEPVKDKYAGNEVYIAVTADYYYNIGMFKEAIPLFNKLIDNDPYSATYWYGLAKCHFEEGNFDQAIDACDYALIGDGKFVDAYVMKGHCFYQLGNEEAALENYKEAQKLKSIDSNFIYSFTGLYNISQGKWEEGLKNLEKVIHSNKNKQILSPILPTLYANAGLCLFKMGEKQKAHQYCQKAQDIAPQDPEAYLVEGRIYIEEGNCDRGIEKWAKALKHAPYPDTWNEIGTHSLEIGYLDYAKIAFERVQELDPDFQGINERLAILYMTLLDKENFYKYNQKCARPFDVKELEQLRTLMESNDKQELANYVQEIIRTLQK